MGHKVNATGFRLRNLWESFWYFKRIKNKQNFDLYDLLIRQYVERICEHQGKILVDLKIFRNLNNCVLFIKAYQWRKRNFLIEQKANRKKRKKEIVALKAYKNLGNIPNLAKHLQVNLMRFLKNKKMNFSVFFTNLPITYKFNRKLLQANRFNKNFYRVYKMIEISLKQQSSSLLAKGLAKFFVLVGKHQKRFLVLVKKLIKFFFFKFKNIYGVVIEINGKLNGKTRSQKYLIKCGSMPLSYINANISYSFSKALTRYGIFGIKVWLYGSNKSYYTQRVVNFNKFIRYVVNTKKKVRIS